MRVYTSAFDLSNAIDARYWTRWRCSSSSKKAQHALRKVTGYINSFCCTLFDPFCPRHVSIHKYIGAFPIFAFFSYTFSIELMPTHGFAPILWVACRHTGVCILYSSNLWGELEARERFLLGETIYRNFALKSRASLCLIFLISPVLSLDLCNVLYLLQSTRKCEIKHGDSWTDRNCTSRYCLIDI